MAAQEELTLGEQTAVSPLTSMHTLHTNNISRSPSVPAALLPPPPTMTTMSELTYVNSSPSPSSYHPGFVRSDLFSSSNRAPTSPIPRQETPFPQKNLFDLKDSQLAIARKIYLKVFFSGLIMVVLVIFMVFPIYWGSLWKVPAKPLEAWVVDFDGGQVGRFFVNSLTNLSGHAIRWKVLPSERFREGPTRVVHDVLNNRAWLALVINPHSTARLESALITPDPAYNGAQVISVYAIEARNENAYRSMLRPAVQTTLDQLKLRFALEIAPWVASQYNISAIMASSPQTVVSPVSYTLINLIPFNQPVASAVTFVGLIYLLILSFFVVMIASGAREAARLDKLLSLRSLVALRLLSSFGGYFLLSLFYSLMNMSFKLDLSRRFGRAGFLAFWLLNYVGMLSVGLALEAMITVLTPKYIPFFMILWIISNVSVCIFPLETLPRIYSYGWAAPFYNVSNSVRAIAFGTRDTLGFNFGILLVWVAMSCISLVFLQWFVRIRATEELNAEKPPNPEVLGEALEPPVPIPTKMKGRHDSGSSAKVWMESKLSWSREKVTQFRRRGETDRGNEREVYLPGNGMA